MNASEKAEKLILAHDGDMALLYIYFSKRKTTDIAKAAKDLFMTLSRAESAYEKLELQGFFDDDDEQSGENCVPVSKVQKADDDFGSSYTSEDIREASTDFAFKAVLDEAERIIGRILTKDDMCRLLDIYKHLSMPADTMFLLLNYCNGISTRKPRISYVQKVAYTWHQNGIIEYDRAEKYVEEDLNRRSDIGKIKSALHIYDRDLTTKEKENANSWLDMGFSEDDVEDAYEICVDRNGKYVNAYINKILINWKENGRDDKKKKAPSAKKDDASAPPLPKTIRKNK